ncbi:MAG TPA: hypothetical protein VNE41_12735 [Chitinophagaceae bacterium]|nr:hypothetical protein [Chitinophagaceae bacterium]
MSSRIVFAVIFLLGAIFQTITIILLLRGNDHYILKVMKRPLAIGFYLIFAVILYYLALRFLLAG